MVTLHSNIAFNFNLRRYSLGLGAVPADSWYCAGCTAHDGGAGGGGGIGDGCDGSDSGLGGVGGDSGGGGDWGGGGGGGGGGSDGNEDTYGAEDVVVEGRCRLTLSDPR
jgi:hypothetical protein